MAGGFYGVSDTGVWDILFDEYTGLLLTVCTGLSETIIYIEREEITGPDYHPFSSDIYKWASQGGSIYIGDQKVPVEYPRLRGPEGEIALKSYQKLKERERFSEELLNKILRGI